MATICGLAGPAGAATISTASAQTTTAPSATVGSALGYDALADKGSLSLITRIVGAQDMWNAGYTGKGVDVAVIDTGVTRVAGLDGAGKVIDGPDLSFDSQDSALAHADSFGHGTHMASIIAGSDVASGTSGSSCATCLGPSAYTDTTKYVGVAPGARVVNVKVGATDGATDVSQVIAAIDWVVQHRNDAGMNIRVLNLSYGTDSAQTWDVDPLSYAVENAWAHGIVVVVAAGNDALLPNAAPLAMPAANPHILAVGAVDDAGTVATGDDEVPDFSQHGSNDRSLDLTAPGVSILGLRVPGGYVDALGTGHVGDRFQRGSGTSEATAVVSGLAALLVQRYPTATPDQLKAFLIGKATKLNGNLPGNHQLYSGKLEANIASAASTGTRMVPPAGSKDGPSTGTGSLDSARGSVRVSSNGVALTGEVDIFGQPWQPKQWVAASSAATAWNGGVWNASQWTGDGWSRGSWAGVAWAGTDWTGSAWSGMRWTGMTWDGARWTGSGWDGSRWSGARWSGARWS